MRVEFIERVYSNIVVIFKMVCELSLSPIVNQSQSDGIFCPRNNSGWEGDDGQCILHHVFVEERLVETTTDAALRRDHRWRCLHERKHVCSHFNL